MRHIPALTVLLAVQASCRYARFTSRINLYIHEMVSNRRAHYKWKGKSAAVARERKQVAGERMKSVMATDKRA